MLMTMRISTAPKTMSKDLYNKPQSKIKSHHLLKPDTYLHKPQNDRRASCKTPCKGEKPQYRRFSQHTPSFLKQVECVINVLKFTDIHITKELGSGGFGTVYEGVFQGKRVAVKKLHAAPKNPKAQKESFRAELHLLTLKHPNIVSTIAASTVDPFIVMEYAGDINLSQLLNDSSVAIKLEQRLKFALEIAKAIEYVHNNYIIHLDIKPANVLITATGVCQLADFGCCQKMVHVTGVLISATKRSYLTGTVAYRAPELLRGQPTTFAADVYSYGITLWQLSTREHPYSGLNQHVIIFRVVSFGLRPPVPSIDGSSNPVEAQYQGLYKQCWAPKADDRPAAKHIVQTLRTWRNIIKF